MTLIDRVKKVIGKVLPNKKPEPDSKLISSEIDSSDAPVIILENQNSVSDLPSAAAGPLASTAIAIPPGPSTSSTGILTETQKQILEQICRSSSNEQRLIERSRIILAYGSGQGKNQIAKELGVDRKTVRKWCSRWNDVKTLLRAVENNTKKISDNAYRKIIGEVLNDAYRPGAPGTFTPEQIASLYAIACEVLDDSAEGVSYWTHQALADQMVRRGIVESISSSSVGRLLHEADLKPHKTRYWLNSPEQGTESFQASSQAICALYKNAAELHQQGVHVISTDEKTGIQALERLNPTHSMEPEVQSCERREHSYERHGTLTLIANFEVATGQVVQSTIGTTRTEQDFVEHIEQTIDTDPDGRWIIISDQLNIHQSASLVELVADRCGIEEDLGEKGKKGILESMESRKEFLEDANHRIQFVYTPKHASWLNQVEIWFSILTRRLLRRGSFPSLEQLQARILSFIEFFNKTMAKPFKWLYTGRPLVA
jgi:transposase